jgi:hypothetical protein
VPIASLTSPNSHPAPAWSPHNAFTGALREDNSTYVQAVHLYIDHEEKNHATVEHDCDFDAYCGSGDKLLPWPLYQIRGPDGLLLAKAEIKATEIVASVEGGGGEENRSFTTQTHNSEPASSGALFRA